MGQTNLSVGSWCQLDQCSKTQSRVIQREITFEAPVQAPTIVQNFLNLKTVKGLSTATMTIYGSSPERMDGVTVMNMLSGLLKDNLVVHIDWNAVQVNTGVQMTVIIKCEYKKWVPLVTSVIENTCAANAQKTYEIWIREAQRVLANSDHSTEDSRPLTDLDIHENFSHCAVNAAI